MYVVMKMQQQSTTGTEGVEVLENKYFEDDDLGKRCTACRGIFDLHFFPITRLKGLSRICVPFIQMKTL